MLDELDSVDWSAVSHAYGAALDVPGQLRALLSTDEAERDSARLALFSNIWNRGMVYPATIQALPFLIDLLEHDATPDRRGLVGLVAFIMSGEEHCEVHEATQRLDPISGVPIIPACDIDRRLSDTSPVVAAIRRIGARAVPTLLRYLKHSDSDARVVAAIGLSSQYSSADVIAPALRAAIAAETCVATRKYLAMELAKLEEGRA